MNLKSKILNSLRYTTLVWLSSVVIGSIGLCAWKTHFSFFWIVIGVSFIASIPNYVFLLFVNTLVLNIDEKDLQKITASFLTVISKTATFLIFGFRFKEMSLFLSYLVPAGICSLVFKIQRS